MGYLEDTLAEMSWGQRKMFAAIAKALGHTREYLSVNDAMVDTLRNMAGEAGRILEADVADQVGELLFDVAHENCDDDGCTGGGKPWYIQVAARLVDPFGPLAAIAVEQQIARDETGNIDGQDSLSPASHLGLLHLELGNLSKPNRDRYQTRKTLISLGAQVVEWLTDLEKPAPTTPQPSAEETRP